MKKNSQPDRMRIRPGFTLVELMVVVTIVAILAASGALYMGAATEKRQVDRAVGRIASVFQELRGRAMSNGQPVILEVSASNVGEGSGEGSMTWFDSTNGTCNDTSATQVGQHVLTPGDRTTRYLSSTILRVAPATSGATRLCFTTAGRVVNAVSSRPVAAVGSSTFGGRTFIELAPTRCEGSTCAARPHRRTVALEFNGLTQKMPEGFDMGAL